MQDPICPKDRFLAEKLLARKLARSFTTLQSFSSNGILIVEIDSDSHPFGVAAAVPNVQDTDPYAKAREGHAGPAEVTDVGIGWEPVALRVIEERIPSQASKATLDTLPVQADPVRPS